MNVATLISKLVALDSASAQVQISDPAENTFTIEDIKVDSNGVYLCFTPEEDDEDEDDL